MSELTAYNNNGLDLLIDKTTGECYASISAVARMCNRQIQTIANFIHGNLKHSQKMDLIEYQTLTSTGLKTVKLLSENQILEVALKYNPELTRTLMKAGLRVYLHQLAG
jgi:hypothetical protein